MEALIQRELSQFFLTNSREIGLGAMVTVVTVRVSPDLSLARCYLSIFTGPPAKEVMANIDAHKGKIRKEIGIHLKSMKKIPELAFFLDDSLDYADKIDELLK